MSPPDPPPATRPSLETLIGRAMRLRCPRCGQGRLFAGWFRMAERCGHCHLKYERAPGYFLGSTYISYAMTVVVLTVTYVALHFGAGLSNRQLTGPLVTFCVVFPMLLFRHSRALWMALDFHLDKSIFLDED